ncbi:MAG: hypothetical protein MZV70_35015 [Desulfobacterales bacterium]|nr:hypothetical protein [Desulfobacterales bacterium]
MTVGDHKVELVGKDPYGSGTARVVEETTSQVHLEVFPAGRLRVKVPAEVLVSLSGKGYSTRISRGSPGPDPAGGESTRPVPRGASTSRLPRRSGSAKGETAVWEPYVSGMLAFAVTPARASASTSPDGIRSPLGEGSPGHPARDLPGRTPGSRATGTAR